MVLVRTEGQYICNWVMEGVRSVSLQGYSWQMATVPER